MSNAAITPKQFTLAIVGDVASRHGVTVEEILGPRRHRHIINARFEAIAKVVEARPQWSYPTIGKLFNRDHSTIMSALDKIGARRDRPFWAAHESTLPAVRSVSDFVQRYEAFADMKEHAACLAVASFLASVATAAFFTAE